MAASVRPCVVCGKNTNRWFMNPEGDYGDHPAHPKCEPKHHAAYAAKHEGEADNNPAMGLPECCGCAVDEDCGQPCHEAAHV